MEQSQVSILAVHVQPNELKSRMQLTDIVNRRRMRHGHMVNINRQMMLEGMRADFHKVDRLSSKVIDIVRNAREVRATTKGGSAFTATLNPNYKWLKTSGLISPDKWGNLPGGEVFTTPASVTIAPAPAFRDRPCLARARHHPHVRRRRAGQPSAPRLEDFQRRGFQRRRFRFEHQRPRCEQRDLAATMPQKVADRIASGLKRFQPILQSAQARDINESDTVVIVADILQYVLGFDKYSEITSEHSIRSTFCDLATRVDGKFQLLIEVKAIGLDLKDAHIKQAVDYAAKRTVFGEALSTRQGIQFLLAELATRIEASRLLTYNAARLRDAGRPFLTEAAICKILSSEVAERVSSLAVNLFGGNGFVKEYPVEKFYRDAKIGQIYEGTTNLQLQTIAKQILG